MNQKEWKKVDAARQKVLRSAVKTAPVGIVIVVEKARDHRWYATVKTDDYTNPKFARGEGRSAYAAIGRAMEEWHKKNETTLSDFVEAATQ